MSMAKEILKKMQGLEQRDEVKDDKDFKSAEQKWDKVGEEKDDKEKESEKEEESEDDAEKEGKKDEEFKVEEVIKELIETGWSGSNESQMKAVQLLKGLATSDDPKANEFMKKLDKFTSEMK